MSGPGINKQLDGIADVRLINIVQTELHLIQRIEQPYLSHGVKGMVKDTSAANKQVTPPPLNPLIDLESHIHSLVHAEGN